MRKALYDQDLNLSMKNLFMIAPYFVPRRRVGALRPFKFAAHLAGMGWNVSVVTICSNDKPADIERKYLEQFNLLEIRPPFDRTRHSGTILREDGTGSTERKKPALMDKIGDWADRHTPLDTWIYLFRLRYGKIRTFAGKQKPDVIWATGDPWSGLWLGKKLSEDLDVPLVADFRDPWTLSGLNLRKRSPRSEAFDRISEEKILGHAKKVVFTSGKTAELYRQHYSLPDEKTKVIYNAYSELFKDDTDHPIAAGPFEKEKYHILFLGRFRRLSPATPIIHVLQQLHEMSSRMADRIVIHSFGGMWDEDLREISETGLEQHFRVHRPVEPPKIKALLGNADLLLVSTAPERDSIIPAKLWDYMSTDKPVLAIAPNEEIGEILEKTGGGAFFPPECVNAIADFILQIMNSKFDKSEVPVSGMNEVERKKFGSAETARQLNRILLEVVSDGGE